VGREEERAPEKGKGREREEEGVTCGSPCGLLG
jgi:hypothetical protein